jgi:hypothetical protein
MNKQIINEFIHSLSWPDDAKKDNFSDFSKIKFVRQIEDIQKYEFFPFAF